MNKLNRATRIIRRQLPASIRDIYKHASMFVWRTSKIHLLSNQTRGWIAMHQHSQNSLKWALLKHCCLLSGRRRGYIKHFRLNRMATRHALRQNKFPEIRPFTK